MLSKIFSPWPSIMSSFLSHYVSETNTPSPTSISGHHLYMRETKDPLVLPDFFPPFYCHKATDPTNLLGFQHLTTARFCEEKKRKVCTMNREASRYLPRYYSFGYPKYPQKKKFSFLIPIFLKNGYITRMGIGELGNRSLPTSKKGVVFYVGP